MSSTVEVLQKEYWWTSTGVGQGEEWVKPKSRVPDAFQPLRERGVLKEEDVQLPPNPRQIALDKGSASFSDAEMFEANTTLWSTDADYQMACRLKAACSYLIWERNTKHIGSLRQVM